MTKPSIAIIGTGNVGGALGRRLSGAGYAVTFGVREGKDLSALLEGCGDRARAASVLEAAQGAEVVMLAVPGPAALDAARALGALEGKVLVVGTNPVKWDAGPVWNPPAAGSLSAAIAEIHPSAEVVKAFNTFGAEFHQDPSLPGERGATVLMAGSARGKEIVATLAADAGFEPVDAGPLRNASVLENVAIAWIHLASVGAQGRDWVLQMVRR